MESKTLRDWRDLEQYGINVLTGESCALSMRLLIDLDTPEAVALIEEFFGSTINVRPNSGWNARGDGTGSIMLTRNIFQDLAAFVLVKEDYPVAVCVDFRCEGYSSFFVEGMSQDEWESRRDRFRKLYPNGYRIYLSYPADRDTAKPLRNQHYWSGRLV